MNAASLATRLWRDGADVDDRRALAGIADDDPDRAELDAFVTWIELATDDPPRARGAAPDIANAVVGAAADVVAALRERDVARLDHAVAFLDGMLDALADDHPRTAAARAWADLALGELALAIGDRPVATSRFEAVAHPTFAPVRLRIVAMRQLIGLALERGDVQAAHNWLRRMTPLVDPARSHAVTSTRLLTGVLRYVTADTPADAVEHLATLVAQAIELDDPVVYVVAVLVGAQTCVALDRVADAIALIDAAVPNLTARAPHLVTVLRETRGRLG